MFQSASFPGYAIFFSSFHPTAFVSGRLHIVWIFAFFVTHSHTLSFAIVMLSKFSLSFFYLRVLDFVAFFLIITTMSVLIGLCVALRVGLRVVAGISG